MKNLAILLLLTVSCGGSDNKATPDGPVMDIDAAPVATCFSGTPTNHDQLINACVDQSVTVIVKYPTLAAELAALPKLNANGTTPPLP